MNQKSSRVPDLFLSALCIIFDPLHYRVNVVNSHSKYLGSNTITGAKQNGPRFICPGSPCAVDAGPSNISV